MISFITDVRPGEDDILSALRHAALAIRDLDGKCIEQIQAPAEGWTHDALCDIGCQLESRTTEGADAYLEDTWVGSTEV